MVRRLRLVIAAVILVVVVLAMARDRTADAASPGPNSRIALTGAHGPPPPPSFWVNVAPLPQSLFGGAATTDGTYVYVFGGYHFPEGPGSTLDTVYRYNIQADTWTTRAPMPQKALGASAVYVPWVNRIYVFGGSTRVPDDPVVVYDATRVYDIATNTWTMGPSM